MKRGKKLLFLLLALAVITGGYFLVRQLSPDTGEAVDDDEAESTPVFNITADDITSISWDYFGDKVTLSRGENGWYYAGGDDFPLNVSVPQTMADTLAGLTATRTLTQVEELSEYGLDDAGHTVTVSAAGNECTISIGSQNSLTEEYYICLDGDPATVYLVSGGFPGGFLYSLYDLIEMEYIPDITNIQRADIETGRGTASIVYLQDNGGLAYSSLYHWFMETEGGLEALGNAQCDEYFSLITGLEWRECVNYKASQADLDAYGLANPAARITLDYNAILSASSGDADGDGVDEISYTYQERSFTLLLGDYADGGCYAMIDGSGMVYLIESATADTLMLVSFNMLRPTDVCLMDWDTVESVGIALDGQVYNIEFSTAEETDEEGSTSTVSAYMYGGIELDTGSAESFIASIDGLTATGEVASDGTGRAEKLSVTFYRGAENFSEMTLTFSVYDSGSCLVSFNGESRLTVATDDVNVLISAAETMLGI